MEPSKELIEACKDYRISAQETLYKTYAPYFKTMCRRYIKDSDQLNDVIQDGFLKIFKSIRDYKGTGSFEGWMKRIMFHTALHQIRKNKKYGLLYSSEELSQFEATMLSDDMPDNHYPQLLDKADVKEDKVDYGMIENADFSREELMDCLRTLKHEFMTVFQLYYIKGMAHNEIAGLLFIDENTSRTRLFRARKLMQEELYRRSINKMTV